ncbi:hypothetical protein B0H14DRAFT_2631796 [Mycena olivaceomarginata]|nr:hypothetical protein B0H14DRAFT_2631796 [Mycena olivaceomarginata]
MEECKGDGGGGSQSSHVGNEACCTARAQKNVRMASSVTGSDHSELWRMAGFPSKPSSSRSSRASIALTPSEQRNGMRSSHLRVNSDTIAGRGQRDSEEQRINRERDEKGREDDRTRCDLTDDAMLRELPKVHFETCIHWHVKGMGWDK